MAKGQGGCQAALCTFREGNFAKDHERGGSGEFAQFLSIAKASASEVRSHLYVALDQGYVDQNDFESLLMQLEDIARKISKLIDYLRSSQIKGVKYRS